MIGLQLLPVAISLRRKGASRPASLSFLITTPESSADAVVLTWGLIGSTTQGRLGTRSISIVTTGPAGLAAAV
jgi:uncharacterized membrane protein YraQ (UPF0718 family)